MESEFDIKDLEYDEKVISSGGQGKVFKGKFKKNIDVIIKQYNSIGEKDNKEITIYKELKHPYIVDFFGSFLDKEKRVNLVLENAKGEDLDTFVKYQLKFEGSGMKLSEMDEEKLQKIEPYLLTVNEKILVILQLCEVLIYLKKKKIIHRDVKPGNIKINKYLNNNNNSFYNTLLYFDSFKDNISTMDELKKKLTENSDIKENSLNDITDNIQNLNIQENGNNKDIKYTDKYNVEMKIFDFGISKVTDATFGVTNSNSYSINYSCPEQYELKNEDLTNEDNDVSNFLVSNKVDNWALGCVISYLFTGIVPWHNKFGNNVLKLQHCLTNKKFEFPIPEKWFPIEEKTKIRITEVLKLCMKLHYKERINAKGLKKLMTAIFFDKDYDLVMAEMINTDSEYYR